MIGAAGIGLPFRVTAASVMRSWKYIVFAAVASMGRADTAPVVVSQAIWQLVGDLSHH